MFEVLVPDERLRSLLAAGEVAPAVEYARGRTTSLLETALFRAYEGVTTVAEALRATR